MSFKKNWITFILTWLGNWFYILLEMFRHVNERKLFFKIKKNIFSTRDSFSLARKKKLIIALNEIELLNNQESAWNSVICQKLPDANLKLVWESADTCMYVHVVCWKKNFVLSRALIMEGENILTSLSESFYQLTKCF